MNFEQGLRMFDAVENSALKDQENGRVRQPFILVAPNGARWGHTDHAALPVGTEEIVRTAKSCLLAGAQGLHLHVREEDGGHSLDSGLYREVIRELGGAVPDLQIQITTEAAGIYDVQAQLDCLKGVRPAWASISVREVARSPELADRIYGLCEDQGTRVQHILYDVDDAMQLKDWQEQGIVRAHQSERLLVLGRYSKGMVSSPGDLDRFPISPDSWMVCAFGAQEHACLLEAAKRGGDLRVGFENSLTDADGNPWPDNASSVAALTSALERNLK